MEDNSSAFKFFKNISSQSFINKGKVGNWRRFFTPEINAEWARWIEDNKEKYGIDHDFNL